ncbi:MAG TPA: flagellar export chaperone FliS [Vicinamibacterales bacterium]
MITTQALSARAAQAYIQTHVQSRSPLELVVMLYDGLLRRLGEARAAITARDLVRKKDAVSRALAILAELQNTLNLDQGGEIARSLDDLYTYVNGRLLEGSARNDESPFAEAERLLGPLRDAWAEIAARETAEGAQPR